MRRRLVQLVVVNALLMGLVGLLSPNFLAGGNLVTMLNNMALEAVVLAAVALLLIGGQIDLSTDGVIAMTGVVTGGLLKGGVNIPLAVAAGIGAGCTVGLVNGFAVNHYRINPLITTLATGWIATGVAFGLTNGLSFHTLPDAFGWLGQSHVGGVRIVVLYAISAVILSAITLDLARFGAHVYLVGDNPESAHLMGVDVPKVRRWLYLASGLASGVAGVALAARMSAATPIAADGTALRVIAAAVIGGCSLAGGAGSILGGVLGLFLMNLLTNAAILVGVSPYWQKAMIGAVLLGAVWLDTSGNHLNLGRFWRKKK